MYQYFKNLNIRKKIIFSFIFVSLIIGSIGIGLGYTWSCGSLFRMLIQMNKEKTDLVNTCISHELDQKIAEITHYIAQPSWHRHIQRTNRNYSIYPEPFTKNHLENLDIQWRLSQNKIVKEYFYNPISLELKQFVQNVATVHSIILTDIRGGLIAASHKPNRFNQAPSDWWQATHNNGKGRIYIGELRYSKSHQKHIFPLALPIKTSDGEVIGVSYIELDAFPFLKILNSFQLSNTSHIVLLNDQARILFHPETSVIGNFFMPTEQWNKIKKSQKEYLDIETTPLYGKNHFYQLARVQNSVLQQNSLNWYTLIVQSKTIAFKFIKELINQAIIIILIVALLIGPGAMLVAKIIAQPIVRLSRSAKKIGEGNLDLKITTNSNDEIGELADTLNKMSKNVKQQMVKKVQEEARYRTLIQNITGVVCRFVIKEEEWAVEFINEKIQNLTGYPPADFISHKSVSYLDLIDPNDKESLINEIKDRLLSNKSFSITYRLKHKDGTTKWVRHNGKIFLNETKKEFYTDSIIFDITESMNAQTELTKTKEILRHSEKMTSLGQLAAGIAHEIKSPIGFVKSNVATLQNYLQEIISLLKLYEDVEVLIAKTKNESIIKKLGEINDFKEQKNMTDLIIDLDPLVKDSLYGLERVTDITLNLKNLSHKDSSEIKEVDLNREIDKVLKIVSNELKYKCKIYKEYSELPLYKCVVGQLNQVFLNLIVNASQAIETKGEIRISTSTDNQNIKIVFSDTGKGIPFEKQEKIFEAFYTTKPADEGTGLGLSITAEIIKKHNGTIKVLSEEGVGTTFIIFLPLETSEQSNA